MIERSYKAYINANKEILIDYDNKGFCYPSTLEGLREVESGYCKGGMELIKIHARLCRKFNIALF